MEKKIYIKPFFAYESFKCDDVIMASNIVEKSDQSQNIFNSDIKI